MSTERHPTQHSHATVVIIEDHSLLAETLALALEHAGVSAQAVNVRHQDVMGEVAGIEPTLALVDLGLGDDRPGGLAFIPSLHEAGIAVLVVTGELDHLKHAEAIEAGALAVLSKSMSVDELIETVKRALNGESLLGQAERLGMILDLERARRLHQRPLGLDELTAREQQILSALCEGFPAGRIARAQGISITTVRTHIRSILSKLGVHSQLEAVTLAVRNGWVASTVSPPSSAGGSSSLNLTETPRLSVCR